MKILFKFEGHSNELLNIEQNQWLAILADMKKRNVNESWNDLKTAIYYSVVLSAYERTPEIKNA